MAQSRKEKRQGIRYKIRKTINGLENEQKKLEEANLVSNE